MRKSFALLAVVAFAGLATDAISATVQQCNSRNNTCFGICAQKGGGFNTEGRCGNRCINVYTNCLKTATGGPPAKIQRGPNAVVTTTKSTRGSTPIQTGPTAVITTTPVRPTKPGGSPCTSHCGPLGGRKK